MLTIAGGIILAVILIRLAPLLGALAAACLLVYLASAYWLYWLPAVAITGLFAAHKAWTTPSLEEQQEAWEKAHPEWRRNLTRTNFDE